MNRLVSCSDLPLHVKGPYDNDIISSSHESGINRCCGFENCPRCLCRALHVRRDRVACPDDRKQTMTYLETLKAMRAGADEKTTADYNKSMDEAWKFYNDNQASVLPILRREIALELQKAKPNDMLLLDIGYFLRCKRGHQTKSWERQLSSSLIQPRNSFT